MQKAAGRPLKDRIETLRALLYEIDDSQLNTNARSRSTSNTRAHSNLSPSFTNSMLPVGSQVEQNILVAYLKCKLVKLSLAIYEESQGKIDVESL